MENLFTIETHLHTAQGSACAVSTGEEMARAHKAAGYDAIILTDHFFGGNTAVPRICPGRSGSSATARGMSRPARWGRPSA